MNRTLRIIQKNVREQMRNFWIFILAVTMAPFFVAVYYLIIEASQPQYDILILNHDKGTIESFGEINYGFILADSAERFTTDTLSIPISIRQVQSRQEAISKLQSKNADALVVLPEDFSENLKKIRTSAVDDPVNIEIVGDISDVYYRVSAIWANEILTTFVFEITMHPYPIEMQETSLGVSGSLDDFDIES